MLPVCRRLWKPQFSSHLPVLLPPQHLLRASRTSPLRHQPAKAYTRQQCIHTSADSNRRKLTPLEQGSSSIYILVAIAVTAGTGYLLKDLLYPATEPIQPQVLASDPPQDLPPNRLYDEMSTIDAAAFSEDRPDTITPEKEEKLRQLWIKLFEVIGVVEPQLTRTETDASEAESNKRKSRGWFGMRSSKTEESGDAAADDKFGLNKEFQKAVASQSKEELRASFWAVPKQDDPDALLLRFLRARKWVIQDALVMLIAAMHWRSVDMKVDEAIMLRGETGFLKMSQSTDGTSTEKKLGKDFMQELHLGKSVLHGTDKAGRPITTVRVKLHKPGAESQQALEMYTVYKIETARFFLSPPVDTATIIFDLTSFTLANMDYAPVKFIIKCFEANYPESLGSVLIYKAPWIFQGIWKIIRGWLDPVVASKINFAQNIDELSQYIDRRNLPKELDGDDTWEYSYTDPELSIDSRLEDTATRDKIKADRKAITEEYEKATIAWARENDASQQEKRHKLRDELRSNYWKLDPYVRARSLYDRQGLIPEGGYHHLTNGNAVRDSKVDSKVDSLQGQVDGLKLENTSTAGSFHSAKEAEATTTAAAAPQAQQV